MTNYDTETHEKGEIERRETTDSTDGEKQPTETVWSDDDEYEVDAAIGEELVRYEGPAEELDVWREPDGEAAVETPPPTDVEPSVDEFDPPTPEEVRSAVLADVKEYFETADLDEEFAPRPTEEFVEESWFDFDYLDSFDEVERKWVNEPYAYISILYDDEDKEYRYHISEPTLDGFEEYVRADLTKILRDSLLYQDVEDEGDRKSLFRTEAKDIVSDHARTVDGGSLYKLLYYLTRDFVEYGKIDPVMRDTAIEDISCDGVDIPVFVYHREFRDLRTNVAFSRAALDSFTVRLAQKSGKAISVSNPLVDASLPDGSRIQLTLGGEVSTRGSNFTIRKFSEIPYTPVDLVNWNTFSVDQMAYFWLAIENNRSLIFAGGTGSGKTTSMNAVSFFIPPNSKVVSIEDTREVTLPHDNWIQSVTRSGISEGGRGEVDMYQLLQSALRQRPEYLLVGEIRTQARVALTFFQAIGTGHTAYTTIHADSPEGVMARLQNEPLSIPAQMIKNLDIVSIQRQIRTEERRVRRTQEVFEILPGGEGNEVLTRTVFERDPLTDAHETVADSHVLAEIMEDRGWDEDRLLAELDLRREVLQYLVDNDISSYADVTGLLHTYHKDPDFVLEGIRSGELHSGDFAEDLDEDAFPETTPSDLVEGEDVEVVDESDPEELEETGDDDADGDEEAEAIDDAEELEETGDDDADGDEEAEAIDDAGETTVPDADAEGDDGVEPAEEAEAIDDAGEPTDLDTDADADEVERAEEAEAIDDVGETTDLDTDEDEDEEAVAIDGDGETADPAPDAGVEDADSGEAITDPGEVDVEDFEDVDGAEAVAGADAEDPFEEWEAADREGSEAELSDPRSRNGTADGGTADGDDGDGDEDDWVDASETVTDGKDDEESEENDESAEESM